MTPIICTGTEYRRRLTFAQRRLSRASGGRSQYVDGLTIAQAYLDRRPL